MTAASSFTSDIDVTLTAGAPVVVSQQIRRESVGSYTVTGARQYAVTNLGADGDVSVDGVPLLAKFSLESALLPNGETFAPVTVVVTGAEAFISQVNP